MSPLDLLTVEEARDACNLQAGHVGELGLFVSGISERIDIACGPVVIRTVTEELHERPSGPIVLKKGHPSAITEVVETSGGTDTTLVAADYRLRTVADIGWLARRSGTADVCWTADDVTVTYTAGRATSTATVPARFKLAAGSILRRLWQREQGAWASGSNPFNTDRGSVGFFKAVDPMIHEFLEDDLRTPAVA